MKGEAPFQQAIAQSPAWQNIPGYAQQENTYRSVLEYASLVANKSITSLADLRGLSTSQLQAVNAIAVGKADWSMFSFGPTVDGKFVPALPSVLLLHGQFDNSVKVMVGHNLNETFLFTPPLLTNDTAITSYFRSAMPSITNATISYLSEVLYPPIFNGSYGYVNDFTRAALIIAESSFTCNTRYLDLAFKNRTYSYFFTVPPGFHGEDTAYTFFDGDTTTSDEGAPVNATVATTFQQYLAGFVMDGNPNSGGRARPIFPLYGSNSTILNIDIQDNGTTMKDTVANARCDWWQRGLYA
jgi:carboxylesterase type B